MQFIPNSPLKKSMLHELQLHNIDDLFSDIPNKIKIENLRLPPGRHQQDVEDQMRTLARQNKSFCEMPFFIGGGYNHFTFGILHSIYTLSTRNITRVSSSDF